MQSVLQTAAKENFKTLTSVNQRARNNVHPFFRTDAQDRAFHFALIVQRKKGFYSDEDGHLHERSIKLASASS